MKRSPALAGLAHVSALVVELDDITGIVAKGVAEAARVLGADAAGVLVVVPGRQDLDVLATTSHAVAELEAHQAGTRKGPCVESLRRQEAVVVRSVEEAEASWPEFGERMRSAGFARMLAVPMRWQGSPVGGLNLFWRDPEDDAGEDAGEEVRDDDERLAQTFADILTLAVVHVYPMPVDVALDQVRGALSARSIVEQAKGVLAETHDVEPAVAYDLLLELADERGEPLGTTAKAVIRAAHRPT
jgi:hypothetical protein